MKAVFFFLLSSNLFAGYIIPQDKDVLLTINESSSHKEVPRHLSILVWNIYKGQLKGLYGDLDRESKRHDILILQEGHLTSKQLEFFSGWNHHTTMATAWIKNGVRSGVVTSSSYLPVKTSWQRSVFREPIIRTPKMTQFTEYAIENSSKTLLVVNIHAINFVTTGKLGNMLVKAFEKIKNHQGPVIFAGDFNTWKRTKIRLLERLMKKHGFKEPKYKNDTRTRKFGWALDYFWYRDLEVVEAKVLTDIITSDHKAISVELKI